MGVSAFQDTSTVQVVQQWHMHTVLYQYLSLLFYNPYMCLLVHPLLVTCDNAYYEKGGNKYACVCYQVTQCDVGVSLHSKTHPLSCCTAMAHAHSAMYTSIRACFLCFFFNTYMYMSQRIFPFTCLLSCLLVSSKIYCDPSQKIAELAFSKAHLVRLLMQ